MMTLFFHAEPIDAWSAASRCDTGAFARYFWGLLERGSYMPCSQYESLFVSAAHSEADVDDTIAAATDVLGDRPAQGEE
jgi:glutamate-1-semialdehyde 2,1-aminomutase